MPADTDVAIIGAGPYALSLAAHLRAAGVDYRMFGRPMELWRDHMPEGMLLKSDGFASNLDCPNDEYTLADYCREHEIEYHDTTIPVQLKTFIEYGMAFQQRYVTDVESNYVTLLHKDASGFQLTLDDGSTLRANRVVLAIGVGYFRYVPPALTALPAEFVSHSYAHANLSPLLERNVIVVGGGSSALDLAGLLNERGCQVQLVARRENLVFGTTPKPGKPSVLDAIRFPPSGLGRGWRSRLCTDAPMVFHAMPEKFRLEVVRRHLGPAASWRTKDKVVGRMPILTGQQILGAAVKNNQVELSVQRNGERPTVVSGDHVVSATGYRVDLRKLEMLSPTLLSKIACAQNTPILSRHFESSVDGLFFIGTAAANSFGPLLRFAFGARFASRRLSKYLIDRLAYRNSGRFGMARTDGSQAATAQR